MYIPLLVLVLTTLCGYYDYPLLSLPLSSNPSHLLYPSVSNYLDYLRSLPSSTAINVHREPSSPSIIPFVRHFFSPQNLPYLPKTLPLFVFLPHHTFVRSPRLTPDSLATPRPIFHVISHLPSQTSLTSANLPSPPPFFVPPTTFSTVKLPY